MEYICNFTISPEDKRDVIFGGEENQELPEVVDYRNELQEIRDQG